MTINASPKLGQSFGRLAKRHSVWPPLTRLPLAIFSILARLAVRKYLFEWLGYYSFGLRLGTQERKMLTATTLATLEANEEEFRTTYTTSSFHHLQQDIYLALSKLLGKCIMLSNLFLRPPERLSCSQIFEV